MSAKRHAPALSEFGPRATRSLPTRAAFGDQAGRHSVSAPVLIRRAGGCRRPSPWIRRSVEAIGIGFGLGIKSSHDLRARTTWSLPSGNRAGRLGIPILRRSQGAS